MNTKENKSKTESKPRRIAKNRKTYSSFNAYAEEKYQRGWETIKRVGIPEDFKTKE